MNDNEAYDFGSGMENRSSWSFNGIADVFDAHVRQSVPGVDMAHSLTRALIATLSENRSQLRLMDIGSSAGTFAGEVAQAFPSINVLGVDIEQSMVTRAQNTYRGVDNLSFICADVQQLSFSDFDVVVSLLSLQFLCPEQRRKLLRRMSSELTTGATLVIFEKFVGSELDRKMLKSYKRVSGLSDQQISDKELALKGILHEFSFSELEELKRFAMTGPILLWQSLQFKCFILQKK